MNSPQTPRRVPITNLGLEYEAIRADLTPLLDKILRSGSYVLGPEGERFEKELAAYIGVQQAIGINSGTDAVLLALKTLNIGPGDEVIVPGMSFFATVEPVVHLGAKPVFVDIDAKSYAIDASKVAAAITPKTKAIIAVHLYGLPADLVALASLANTRKIPLIEDMAQAIGSAYRGKKIGSWGDISCLSFYPTKNLGACGDAGAVMTSNAAYAERLRSLRNHGAPVKYHHEEVAFNTRLDEIQAAILRLKLQHLESWNEKRRAFAAAYTKALQGLPIVLPTEYAERHHVYHLYTIQAEDRDTLKASLDKAGISVGLHYPIALHLLPALKSLGHKPGDFPNSEALARRTLSLPLFPFMTAEDVQYVAEQVQQHYKTRA